MKIAHVVDSMEMGGAETLVSQMCHLQREQGHEPCVYAVAALGTLGERMRAEGFSVQSNIGVHLVDSARKFYRIFKASKPDVVHLHNPTPTIYASAPARMVGVASVVSTRHSLVAPPRNLRMERKYAIAARFCDWVVGICDATTDNIRDAGSAPSRKIVRIYNGALPMRRVALDQRPAKDGFTLLYVGRLEAVKNHPLLLNAFCSALSQAPDLQLWIVGDGSERKRLEELVEALNIRKNVKFWGQQLDVAPYFSSADAFIMSSVSEGLPMSLLQAFSVGLPALVTDVGGMAEVVRLGQAGLTVAVTDADAMTAAILRMVGNPAEREQFSQKGEAAFAKYFTLQAMADSYMELYRNTPRSRGRAKQGRS